MLWDVYQQYGIHKNRNRISHAEREHQHGQGETRDLVRDLHERLDTLLMVNEAMWQLFSERMGLSEEQLTRKVYELDMADGVTDGQRTSAPESCECGAKVNPQSTICIFCGAPAPARPFFDRV